jgi:hypothetical protein
MAISKIPSAGFQDNVKFRNIIINGDMSIAQRGTSQASITSAGYYTVDRWRTDIVTAGTWTQTQSTEVPTGQGFFNSLKLDCTTADASLAAGDRVFYSHRIEDQNCTYLKKGTSSAESTTVSFWVKSNKTGTYICELFDSQNSRHINKSYTISSADTWEKKTITFAGDTTGAFANDNGIGLMLQFWLAAGSNYTSGTLQTSWNTSTNANRVVGQVNLADSTDNEWYITGVQLEAGTTASDFEFLPVDVNLKRCERYYETLTTGAQQNFGTGLQYSSSKIFYCAKYRTTKRAVPSLDQVTGTNIYSFYRNNAADNFNGFDQLSNRTTATCAELDCSTNISGTGGQAGFFRTGTSATTAFVAFDAEL